MKKLVKKIPILGPLLRQFATRYRQWKTNPTRIIQSVLGRDRDVFVVQIGSNDGLTGDPIHDLLNMHPAWQALFVEPMPHLFSRLCNNYGNDIRFKFLNAAITDVPGEKSFFYIADEAKAHIPDLPVWYDQLGSFSREHITKHFPGSEIEAFICETTVRCEPLMEALRSKNVSKIDLLHIDTEGHDWQILKQLDLSIFLPRVILFEHHHLTEEFSTASRSFLEPHYQILDLPRDRLCIRTS